jgi:2-dehydro-3-deoxyphosphogluconate aldolase / (4S)-4-hydroxy-2-oxoglutarate aldolase
MEKLEARKWIAEIGVIPVIRAESAEIALRAIRAIEAGGLSVLEITMTIPGAIRVIETVVQEMGSRALIGAGTVLNKAIARECIAAGAEFIVSPAVDTGTIEYCRSRGVTVMPGAMTPTEVVTAWSAGADFVKIFPAGALGGPSYIRSLKAPLPEVPLVPTGGVSLKNAGDFIKAGAAALGVGASLLDAEALRNGSTALATEHARKFIEIVNQARSEIRAGA